MLLSLEPSLQAEIKARLALALVSARELACGVEGCSQLLAADLCKYGLWNLAPILPSLPSSPTPEQTGH